MNVDEGLRTLQTAAQMLDPARWDRVLYIGWHPKTFAEWEGDWYLMHMKGLRPGRPVSHTIIETWKPYADELRAHPKRHLHGIRVLHADVVEWSQTTNERFDVVMWWHGPEHVDQDHLGPTLSRLEAMCDGIVILGCPDGDDPYQDESSEDHHRCVIDAALLERAGYTTVAFDRAWKSQDAALAAFKLCAVPAGV